jgi:DNA-binding NtrC family response regulator
MPDLNQPRILIVDDEDLILDALRRQLHSCFNVATATGAKEAINLIMSQGPYAVVVSDLRMPAMDGVTLLYLIRQIAPNTVRILLTGKADLEAATLAVNMGNVFRFLTKPCPTKTLLRALNAAVEQYEITTASPPDAAGFSSGEDSRASPRKNA